MEFIAADRRERAIKRGDESTCLQKEIRNTVCVPELSTFQIRSLTWNRVFSFRNVGATIALRFKLCRIKFLSRRKAAVKKFSDLEVKNFEKCSFSTLHYFRYDIKFFGIFSIFFNYAFSNIG